LTLRTATNVLHSGSTGRAIRNPLAELMQVVAACVDGRTGRVLSPGFYDEVEELSLADEDAFLSSGLSVETFQRDHQISASSLRSTDPLEIMRRLWALPTFDVHRCGRRVRRAASRRRLPRAPKSRCRVGSCRTCPARSRSSAFARLSPSVSPTSKCMASPALEP
jgi:hypothetical protein